MAKRSNWYYDTFRTGNLRFQILGGDINWDEYGATWFRQTKADRPHTYQVVRFENMEELVGKREWSEEEHDSPYLASYTVIDLEHGVSEEDIKSALDSCGFILKGNRKNSEERLSIVQEHDGSVVADTPRRIDLVILEALIGYGIDDWTQVSGREGETARQLRARCAQHGY